MHITWYIFFLDDVLFALSLRGRKKDWFNNAFGGAAAGLSVALLSRHTRTPQMLAAHVAGAAAITSVVAIATGPPVGS